MERNAIAAVTGMTGVGKDFLVERANEQFELPVLNLGTLIGQKLEEDRDSMMSTVSPDKIYAAQLATYAEVVIEQPLIVTCHAVRPSFQNPSIQNYDLPLETILNPYGYIFIKAPPETIAERVRQRNLRGERKSSELPPSEIHQQQETKHHLLQELVGTLGCRLLVIENTDDAVTKNIALVQDFLQDMQRFTANQ